MNSQPSEPSEPEAARQAGTHWPSRQPSSGAQCSTTVPVPMLITFLRSPEHVTVPAPASVTPATSKIGRSGSTPPEVTVVASAVPSGPGPVVALPVVPGGSPVEVDVGEVVPESFDSTGGPPLGPQPIAM